MCAATGSNTTCPPYSSRDCKRQAHRRRTTRSSSATSSSSKHGRQRLCFLPRSCCNSNSTNRPHNSSCLRRSSGYRSPNSSHANSKRGSNYNRSSSHWYHLLRPLLLLGLSPTGRSCRRTRIHGMSSWGCRLAPCPPWSVCRCCMRSYQGSSSSSSSSYRKTERWSRERRRSSRAGSISSRSRRDRAAVSRTGARRRGGWAQRRHRSHFHPSQPRTRRLCKTASPWCYRLMSQWPNSCPSRSHHTCNSGRRLVSSSCNSRSRHHMPSLAAVRRHGWQTINCLQLWPRLSQPRLRRQRQRQRPYPCPRPHCQCTCWQALTAQEA
jgi:hypothetical protein